MRSESQAFTRSVRAVQSDRDISNRIIGEEIIDETDRYQDNQSKKAAKRQGTAAVMRELFRLFLSFGSKICADHHFLLLLGGIIERHKNVSIKSDVARQSVDLTTPRRYRLFTLSRVLNRRLRWRAV